MERRDFLRISAAGAVSLAGRPAVFDEEKPQRFRIGMAATTWLTATPTTAAYWSAAEAIASLNIGASEADNSEARLDSTYGDKVGDFVSRSRKVGVYLTGVYQALQLHNTQMFSEMQSKVRSVASFLKAAGAAYIALGWDTAPPVGGKPYQRTPEDVRRAVHASDEFGRLSLEEFGIPIAFHAERDIPKEMVLQILDDTNPKYVRLCADVGHLTAMGLDALQVVKKYASRLTASHWKDFDPKLPGPDYLGSKASGDFVEVGKGIVDFPGLADFYREIKFNGWVMLELDRTREPSIMASAHEMKAFVTEKLGLQFYPPSAAS
jgi:sugar phosphate isomerase/epimerase